MQFSAVSLAVFVVLGVMTGWKLPYTPWALWTGAALAWVGAVFGYRRRSLLATHAAVGCMVILLAALRCQMTDPIRRPDSLHRLVGHGRCTLELVVVEPVTEDRSSYEFLAEVVSVRLGHRTIEGLHGMLSVRVDGRPADGPPEYGSHIRAPALIEELPDRYASPWSNGRDHLHARGVVGRASMTAFSVKILGRSPPSRLRAWLYDFRNRVTTLLTRTHEAQTAAILEALLFGERESLTPTVWRDFRRAGTVHLLAQSGLHVGILAIVLYVTASAVGFGRRRATAVTLIVLALYCVIAGERPAVLRASLMTALILVGRSTERSVSYFTSLAAAAIVMLVYDPASLAQPGFQLSFVATLGILYLSPPLADLLCFLPTGLAGLASVSIAAFLATAPLLLYHFDGIPLAAPLANVVVLPLIGVILPCALLTVATGLVSPWVAFFFGAANYAFVSLLLMANSLFASSLFPLIRFDSLPYPVILGWYLLLVSLGDRRLRQVLTLRDPAAADAATELLERDASGPDDAYFRDLIVAAPEDPLLSRVFDDHRPLVTQALPTLRLQLPEARKRLAARLGERWPLLTARTTELLLFAECWHLAARLDEFRPAMAALLLAVEHEMAVRLFGPLREFARTFPTAPRGQELRTLAGDSTLPLPVQLDILWLIATPGGPKLEPLILAVRGMLSRLLPDASVVLDAARLPLHLDQLMRRHYWKLPLPGHVNLGTLLAAREAVVGGAEHGLLGQVLACLPLTTAP